MFGSDDMYARLLDLVPGERPFPSIKWAGYANFNAALADLAERAEPRGLRLVGLYGMSEVQALYARQPLDAPIARRKLGGGTPTSPLAHVRIEDGELQCAGPSLMVGYWGNEKATAETLTADGYVRTGDLAEADGQGGFTFLSRMGDVLRLSGFLVNPLEIEQHIQKMPGIEGCQTIALPRTDGVQAVAFVMLKPGASARRGGPHRPLPNAVSPATRCRCACSRSTTSPGRPRPTASRSSAASCARWPKRLLSHVELILFRTASVPLAHTRM